MGCGLRRAEVEVWLADCKVTSCMMDIALRQELISLVEDLTHSGAPSLNEEKMKRLKNICKKSELYITTLYDQLMTFMKKKHAEIRLSAFQIVDEFFSRSHDFRELVVADLQKLVNLVTDTNPKHPMPPPKAAASLLKQRSLLAIREWNLRFGDGYSKLRIGYKYLKFNKKVDFDELVAQSEASRRLREERERRKAALLKQRLEEIKREMREMEPEITSSIKQSRACFDLLFPRFEAPEQSYIAQQEGEDRHGGEAMRIGEEKGEFRRKILSSESFASIESSECDDTDDDFDTDDVDTNTGDANTLVNTDAKTDDVNTDANTDAANTDANTDANIGVDDGDIETSDVDFDDHLSGERLRGLMERLYGPSSAATGKKGKGGTMASSKGKDAAEGDGVSSDESEVEWEEVEPLREGEWEGEDWEGEGEGEGGGGGGSFLQEHGFSSRHVTIPIELFVNEIEVSEDEDNSSVLVALRESQHMLGTKYLSAVHRWIEWLTKGGTEEALKSAIDLKSEILAVRKQYNRLKINFRNSDKQSESESVVVPPSSKASSRKAASSATVAIANLAFRPLEGVEKDPTTPQAQVAVLKKKLSSHSSVQGEESRALNSPTDSTSVQPPPSKQELLARAPVVPFDNDLYHWEAGYKEPPRLAHMDSLHRYWVNEHEVNISEDEKSRLKCRTITFLGKFEPVKWSCRAPLPNGRLCPRRDRFKCPFHGPIVPRDNMGNPENPSDASESSSATPLQPRPLEKAVTWEDIEEDVLANKGLQPAGKRRKTMKDGKKQRRKHEGLTDLKEHKNTSRKRLEEKIFNKRALKRVGLVMDAVNSRINAERFGNSFHYALKQ